MSGWRRRLRLEETPQAGGDASGWRRRLRLDAPGRPRRRRLWGAPEEEAQALARPVVLAPSVAARARRGSGGTGRGSLGGLGLAALADLVELRNELRGARDRRERERG
jgi:hypothetical protein